MSPKSFTFKLIVPRDPQAAPIVADVAGHAVGYAGIDAARGAGFVVRVNAAVAGALTAPGPPAVQIIVTGDTATLTFAIDAVSVAVEHSV